MVRIATRCHSPPVLSLLLLFAVVSPLSAADVPLLGMVQQRFEHRGDHSNPYIGLAAIAELTEPDARTTRTIPLFWDGGRTWRFRFSPDKTRSWKSRALY